VLGREPFDIVPPNLGSTRWCNPSRRAHMLLRGYYPVLNTNSLELSLDLRDDNRLQRTYAV
jgi:hypothetical protein